MAFFNAALSRLVNCEGGTRCVLQLSAGLALLFGTAMLVHQILAAL